MAITIQSSSSSDAHSGSTTTLANVVVASGADKIVVAVSSRDLGTRPVTSMTRDGQSFTRAALQDASGGNRTCAEIWYLDSPNTGTADIEAEHDEFIGFVVIAALVLEGAASGTAEDTDGTSANSANPSVTLTCTADALAVAAGAWDTSGAATESDTAWYTNAGTRLRQGQYANGVSAGSKTLTFTKSSTTNSVVGASFAAAAGTPTVTPTGTTATPTVGTPTLSTAASRTPTGAVSGVELGALAVTLAAALTPTAVIVTPETGTPSVESAAGPALTAAETGVRLGTLIVSSGAEPTPNAAVSGVELGRLAVTAPSTLTPTGVVVAGEAGTPLATSTTGATALSAESTVRLGTLTLADADTITPVAVSVAPTVGTPTAAEIGELEPLAVVVAPEVGAPLAALPATYTLDPPLRTRSLTDPLTTEPL